MNATRRVALIGPRASRESTVDAGTSEDSLIRETSHGRGLLRSTAAGALEVGTHASRNEREPAPHVAGADRSSQPAALPDTALAWSAFTSQLYFLFNCSQRMS